MGILMSKWIKCSDRLPDSYVDCLIFSEKINIGIDIAVIDSTGKWSTWIDYFDISEITHWQPLPDQPAEDE